MSSKGEEFTLNKVGTMYGDKVLDEDLVKLNQLGLMRVDFDTKPNANRMNISEVAMLGTKTRKKPSTHIIMIQLPLNSISRIMLFIRLKKLT